jgi:SAM-dependent methyltransferase
MTPEELETLERQRREADRSYNEALTALDRAIVTVSRLPTIDREYRERVATTLMEYLQQITGFVETKDRELDARASARVDGIAREVESLGELRVRVGVLQRATEMLTRSGVAAAPDNRHAATDVAPAMLRPADDYKYLGFEDAFRGPDEVIEERLRAYVPLFAGRTDVLDIGCGRGELLAALRTAGVPARGLDTNADMVAVSAGRGLDATRADALAYLSSLPDRSLGGIVATQVVEHLEPAYLMRLLDAAARTLRPGSPIVLETINAACWLAFFSSYVRDITHVRPLHPETLQYLLRASGFERVELHFSAPVSEQMKMKTVDLPAEVLRSADPADAAMARIAHAVNANALILNSLLFTHLDFAAIGYRS